MSEKLELSTAQKVHFIGIGGSSMSGLAKRLYQKGYFISGSDRVESENTHELKKLGVKIHIGHSYCNVEHCDVVIITDAIQESNVELKAARSSGKLVIKRAQLLNSLLSDYAEKIAISGTHGKSSTTKMLHEVLISCNQNAAAYLGVAPSYISGEKTVVYESCEYKRNFLLLDRTVCGITNIDLDHMDFFKNLQDIIDSYNSFARGKCTFINGDDMNCKLLSPHEKITFGLGENCDYRGINLAEGDRGNFSYDVLYRKERLCRISLNVMGKHNVYNSLLAFAIAHNLGFDVSHISHGLSLYSGIARRMQYMGEYRGSSVVLDYAHHPNEIASTISACKGFLKKRLVCVFQPHMYSRLKSLLSEFSECFKVDALLLARVYAAREKPIKGVHSKALKAACEAKGVNAKYFGSFKKIKSYLRKNLQKNDLLLILGAGDIDRLAKMLDYDSSVCTV